MVFMQNIHVLNCRHESKSAFKVPFRTNPFVVFSILSAIILQVIVMEVPVLSTFLSTYSIPFKDMFILFGLALPVLVVMELFKKIKNLKNN
jgi:magnesium-transporting ATPase (P-type)